MNNKATLIRIDEISIEQTKKGLNNSKNILNKFIELTETTLKTTLTDKEKVNLKDNGLTFVNEWLKPKFQFPDADDVFNMNALGISTEPITNYWNANAKYWVNSQIEIVKGKFCIPNMDKLDFTKHYHYAKNERQEKMFKEATEICKALNRLLDKKLIIEGKERDISNGFKFVRFGTKNNIKDPTIPRKFYPVEWQILKL